MVCHVYEKNVNGESDSDLSVIVAVCYSAILRMVHFLFRFWRTCSDTCRHVVDHVTSRTSG